MVKFYGKIGTDKKVLVKRYGLKYNGLKGIAEKERVIKYSFEGTSKMVRVKCNGKMVLKKRYGYKVTSKM